MPATVALFGRAIVNDCIAGYTGGLVDDALCRMYEWRNMNKFRSNSNEPLNVGSDHNLTTVPWEVFFKIYPGLCTRNFPDFLDQPGQVPRDPIGWVRSFLLQERYAYYQDIYLPIASPTSAIKGLQ